MVTRGSAARLQSPLLLLAFTSLLLRLFLSLPTLVVAEPSDPSYRLVWSDEFSLPDYSPPDPAVWSHDVGPGPVVGGNNELEYYTAARNNSFVVNHSLVIQSLYQPHYRSGYNFTSGRITSLSKVELYLGYVEARIRVLTMADGHWPAFWMLGHCSQPYPNCGEIDIMEQVNGPIGNSHGNDKQQCGTLWSNPDGINGSIPTGPLHQSGGCVEVGPNATQWGDDWHVYAMKWNVTAIDFLVDGVTYSSSTFGNDTGFDCYQTPTDPYYLLINLAEGGDNPGVAPDKAAFPTQLQLDWVRVWQQKDGRAYIHAPNSTAPPAIETGNAVGSSSSSSGSASSSSSSNSDGGESGGSSGGQVSTNGASKVASYSYQPWVMLLYAVLCSCMYM